VTSLRHGARARIAAVGAATAGALLLAGCGAANETAAPAGGSTGGGTSAAPSVAGTIAGAGASSQQAAQEAWIAGFTGANPDANITYDPSGSGAGRTQFLGGGVAFAGSDAALKEEELVQAKSRCGGDVVEVPAYVSPIAVIYNVPGVTELNLAPATIAQIFDRKIAKWNDPAIAADNPGAQLPDLAITPVNRSDKSGTTQNFADYLKTAAPDAWTYDVSDTWPVAGGEAAQGTSGVVGAVTAGQGAIGYADESQAKDLGQIKVKVGDAFVGPTPEAAAAVLEASTRIEGQGDGVFAYELARDTTAAGTYPVVLVSYLIACAKYPDVATADLVKSYLTYVVSADGQQVAADTAGAAPLSEALRGQITPAIGAIAGGA
jgi:phosphate transport system substrate-binding protein